MGGQDATEAFEDVGHSDEAREILEGLLIADLKRLVSLNCGSRLRVSHGKHYLLLLPACFEELCQDFCDLDYQF